jgi:UDP-glucose 4-epimerase
MSRYLVTGGAGFIGSHLTDALLGSGHAVTVLDDLSTGKRENLPQAATLIEGSVTDAGLVQALLGEADGCFHLAAISSVQRCTEDWAASHEVNVGGAVNVFAAAIADKIPVVYASSAAIYGDNQNLPLKETETPRPLSAYGVDKLATEWNAGVASIIHGIPTTGLRFFNVYGPRQDPASPYSGVISIFAQRLQAGQPITIFGDGKQTRDFVFVADAVAALMRAMQNPSSGKVFNVATGRAISLLQLADQISLLTKRKPDIKFAAGRPGDIRHSRGDPAAFAASYKFTPDTQLYAGLAQTITAL